MSEVVRCPTCGGPAHASRTETDPAGQPALTALTPGETTDKLAQFREVIRIQKDQLDAANQRVRDLEELLRYGGHPRPGAPSQPPTVPPTVPPGFPGTPFQGSSKAGVF